MIPLYPAFLNLAGKLCVVIGGGEVASRKAESLLECGARVRVVAPRLAPRLHALACAGRIEWQARAYSSDALLGAFLAVAATNDHATNAAIVEDALERRILVGSVDHDSRADFATGAVARRGPVAVAISTSGTSPAFSRWLRQRVEELLERTAPLAEIAAGARSRARSSGATPCGAAWREALTAASEVLPTQGAHAAERLMEDLLAPGACSERAHVGGDATRPGDAEAR